jgi:glycosidase
MTQIEAAAPTRLADASLTPRGSVHKSPGDWRDQILYFLLPDRFSNAAPGPLYDRRSPGQFATADKAAWMNAGRTWQGGTIQGITASLDYLRGLGVTALWIGPVWKQRADLATYHGYGIQDFLDVDPRFGTRQDLRDLVDAAHTANMYVILDIIYNHTGNNFFYALNGGQVESTGYRYSPPYDVTRWRSSAGTPIAAIGGRDDGVWPVEFQNLDWYTRAGSIGHWDAAPWENPLDPRNEFRRGDFFDLKDLGVQESAPSVRDPRADQVLSALIKVYQYWIALTDCDGFRVDTVKHVSFEASRNFCGAIHEYTESIGKENFLVLGEVAGGAGMTRNYLDIFGRNLDAALDLGEPMETLTNLAKGFQPPSDFFAEFGGHDELGTHREIGRYHVSMIDDHDMIHRKPKRRFAGGAQQANAHGAEQAALAVGIQLTTLGIPCIYYGTEQAFDGGEHYHDGALEPLEGGTVPYADRYVREAMFGATFGAFGTSGCSFFDQDHPAYLRIGALCRVVKQETQVGRALRRGRQYARPTKVFGPGYTLPGAGELVAWSRIVFQQEVLVAANTHGAESRGAWVTISGELPRARQELRVLYRSDWSDAELKNPPVDQVIPITRDGDDGRSVVRIDLPPAGMIILA